MARVQAVLRRTAGIAPDRVIRLGALEVDPISYIVSVRLQGASKPLDLTLTEFRVIEFMARHLRRVFTRGEIVDACLPGEEVQERTVDSHMSKLRHKLKIAGLGDVLSGVRGVGYRLDMQ